MQARGELQSQRSSIFNWVCNRSCSVNMKTWKHETWNRPLAIFKKHASECLFWTFDARDFCPPAVLRRTLTPWIRTPPVIRIYNCLEFASLQETWWSWIGGSKLSIFPPSAVLSVKLVPDCHVSAIAVQLSGTINRYNYKYKYNYYYNCQDPPPKRRWILDVVVVLVLVLVIYCNDRC